MKENKNFICIIPARGGSKGIHKKNITNFCNKPLLVHSIEQAMNSEYLRGSVFVTSDSDEILEVALKNRCNTIKRPDDISGDKATSESALIHAVEYVKKSIGTHIDYVVFLQPTSPLRETKDIDNAIEQILKNDFDSLFSACELEDFFIWNKENDGSLKSLNYDYNNRKRRQDLNKQYVENGSIYVFKPKILIENNNRMGGKIGLSVMENWKIHEIDNNESLELCEFYYRKKISKM